MPLTFMTYAIGMLALCGFPLLFSGFWSKDGILEAAQHWSVAKTPFYMLVFGALLTAFYMTRQVATSSSATGAAASRRTRARR
jgi:NADH-quinone oxidoreductase subunit L